MSSIPASDRELLRDLGRRKAAIARLPIQAERFELWRRLNRRQSVRPMVNIQQVPWHELNVNDELTCRCTDPFLRGVEWGLRAELYQWAHLPGDMIVEPVIYVGLEHGPQSIYADYGIQEKPTRREGAHDVSYAPVIRSEKDVDQLKVPAVWVNREATERQRQLLADVFAGVLEVRPRGLVHFWHAPWDMMIHWYGAQQLFLDMLDRPELVHYLLRKFTDAVLAVLARQQELGILDVGNGNYGRGSGGLAVTDELPDESRRPQRVTPQHQWGCATGQIFSEVSPAMHEEFCLRYELEWLKQFKLSYYGCCEPLHHKLGILRAIPNLRAVSMSPKADIAKGAQALGDKYVFSFKPNPAMVAWDDWRPAEVEAYLRDALEKTRGCHVEIVFKDITTVRQDPRRLWDWAAIASRLAHEFAR